MQHIGGPVSDLRSPAVGNADGRRGDILCLQSRRPRLLTYGEPGVSLAQRVSSVAEAFEGPKGRHVD